MNKTSELNDSDYVLFTHDIGGFSLKDRYWCRFKVDLIEEIDFNTSAFEKLILPEDQKDMISSLVHVHENRHAIFSDVIAGKGRGMVFLLHGESGTGKTLTAGKVYL